MILFVLRDVALDSVVDAHEPAESAEQSSDDRERRPAMKPPVQQPSEGAEKQDREREGEAGADVRIALAETSADRFLSSVGMDGR